ncbi:hypothetical protein C8P68_101602 [Mucilaginibacter yixingensis]|uniref:GLPGLI family protein n=1 Tax=Mucilaginibacter yixingensis TaxID=1295612 RepID=A0A2T5JG18_9SPHI|nr:hypothetical protein [Mucilaginibacter yixingensis]PTR01368.1 hypothetical protein C8P68_101602 [Mucilaginibacter yixingensis]
MKPKALPITLLLLAAFNVHAQKKDYIINTKGDTIWCNISNPLLSKIKYTTADGQSATVTTETVSEYYCIGKKIRRRAVYVENKTEPEFLTVLENGSISLYEAVATNYNGISGSSVTVWFISKDSDQADLIKTSGAIIGKSEKDLKDTLADMLKDKKEIYDAYITEDKFSFKQIQKLVHWYNTGEKN